MGTDRENPLDQLVDLLIYAPVGLLYEYDEVLPKLIRRGRSQVALARFLGQMAVRKGSGTAEDALGDLVTAGAGLLARAITEFGAAVGLAPDGDPASRPPTPAGSGPADGSEPGATAPAERSAADPGSRTPEPATSPPDDPSREAVDPATGTTDVGQEHAEDAPVVAPDGERAGGALPIAGYDQLPARAIVPLLDDLTPTQRARIRAHESAGRARKTVLAKLDRLDRS